MNEVIKELTDQERMAWGKCPVCEATHGQQCDILAGIVFQDLEFSQHQVVLGLRYQGYHIKRFNSAPTHVQLVPWQNGTVVEHANEELNSSNSSAGNASSVAPS